MQIQRVLLNLKAASAGAFERPAPLFWFAAAPLVAPFIPSTPEEAIAQATAAHPGDEGSFVQYIPLEKMARVYANQR
jgi:hypothetical protein